ncbi:MAG: DUF167 domain-containing protein [Candidatus Aenigmatarchaeota archaeon]
MLIKVKVFPNSKKEEIIQNSNDSFFIKVKEKAEKNLANKRVVEILANHFKVPAFKIKLTKGSKQPNKIFEIKN